MRTPRRRLVVAWMTVVGFFAASTERTAADEEPRMINLGESDDGPSPVIRENLLGEWTGIVPERNALVTVRFHDGSGATLTVAEEQQQSIAVQVYENPEVEVQPGRFVVRAGNVVVEANAVRSGDRGWGEGSLTIDDANKAQSSRAYFFTLGDQSWIRRMAELQGMIPVYQLGLSKSRQTDGKSRQR